MYRILDNDGIHASAKELFASAGHELVTDSIPQTELPQRINEFDGIIVRSATNVRKDLIDQMDRTKLIIRAGVGMDNIDVDYARKKGIKVANTPTASSRSVAELAFAHLMSLSRNLNRSNQLMPNHGSSDFKKLKKAFSKGREIEGKTLGIMGFGRIGQELAKMAIGTGMKVIAHDTYNGDIKLEWSVAGQAISTSISNVSKEELISKSDYISLHLPAQEKPALGAREIDQCKQGVILINTARGGVIDEDALQSAILSGKVAGAALDVFLNEPSPNEGLLQAENLSLSPHIGASTAEAQMKIAKICLEIVESL